MSTSRDLAAQLAHAAALYRAKSRQAGLGDPPAWADLERILIDVACDSERLEATGLAFLADNPHGDAVLAYKTSQVARMLSVSRRTIERLVASGELDSVEIGSETRIPHSAVVDFMAAKRRSFRDNVQTKTVA